MLKKLILLNCYQNFLNLVLGRVGLRRDGGVDGGVTEEEDAEGETQPPELDSPAVRLRIPVLLSLDHEVEKTFCFSPTGNVSDFFRLLVLHPTLG